MRVVKESSDELNPPVVVSPGVALARVPRKRLLRDYTALAIATCGVGYLPLAPGTWGSLVGVGVYLLVREASARILAIYSASHIVSASQSELIRVVAMLLMVFVITAAGVWAATKAETLLGRKDPGAVVVDEVAGQLITFLFVPLSVSLNWWLIGAGFLLFRAFDIWKPYPVRRLEALEAGLGIMADDVLAGVYAATLMLILVTIYTFL